MSQQHHYEESDGMLTRYSRSLTGVFGTPSRALVRGKGVHVWDADGRRYTDFLAGIAVNALGHAHPLLVDAVSKQLATLGHISNLFTSPTQIELAEKLLELAGAPIGSTVFFANSGTEANEAAFKLARRHGQASGGSRNRIIALENGFHGRTMGALALTWKEQFKEPFEPLPGGVEHVPAGDAEALKNAMDETVSALVIEPVQGESGVHGFPEGYLQLARDLCTQFGALLIFDEIQTGMARTGTWFAYQNPEVTGVKEPVLPDAMTLAKGLGGGIPIGALISFGTKVSELLTPGQHGTTFGGNPVATAAGLEVIRIIEGQNLLQQVKETSATLANALKELPLVESVRAYGLLIGVDINTSDVWPHKNPAPLGGMAPLMVQTALEHGFIINAPGPNTLRLAPPLILNEDEALSLVSSLTSIAQDALAVSS